MPSFIGTWNTKRYRANDPSFHEDIQIAITEDSDPAFLDGAYPMPGPNARMFGQIGPNGNTWSATFDEGDNTHTGQAMFVLSDDGNTMYGAWTGTIIGTGTHPWFGVRVS